MGEDGTLCCWVEGGYPTNVAVQEETEAGSSPHLLSLWTEGPTWGCRGFQGPGVSAAAGLDGVRAGAAGGGGGEGFLGRTVWIDQHQA